MIQAPSSKNWYIVALSIIGTLFPENIHAATPPPLIVVDRWWGVDYAKVNCFKEVGNEQVCNRQMTENYTIFELELKTQFASNTECSGITVSSFGYPEKLDDTAPNFTTRPYWSFSINYIDGRSTQVWQMLPPKGSDLPMMQATGTPAQIAEAVCTIIKGKGGAVSH